MNFYTELGRHRGDIDEVSVRSRGVIDELSVRLRGDIGERAMRLRGVIGERAVRLRGVIGEVSMCLARFIRWVYDWLASCYSDRSSNLRGILWCSLASLSNASR